MASKRNRSSCALKVQLNWQDDRRFAQAASALEEFAAAFSNRLARYEKQFDSKGKVERKAINQFLGAEGERPGDRGRETTGLWRVSTRGVNLRKCAED